MKLASSFLKVLAAAALIAALFPMLAQAQSPQPAPSKTVFGFEFGKPIDAPECQFDTTSDQTYESLAKLERENNERRIKRGMAPMPTTPRFRTYAFTQPVTCVEIRGPISDSGAEYRRPRKRIVFGEREKPTLLKVTTIGIETIEENGVLIGLQFRTGGASTQEHVLSELIAKYGQPTTHKVGTVQNRMGAKFDDILACWKFSDLEVTFYGTFGRIDEGQVTIDTPEAARMRMEWREADRASEKKL